MAEEEVEGGEDKGGIPRKEGVLLSVTIAENRATWPRIALTPLDLRPLPKMEKGRSNN